MKVVKEGGQLHTEDEEEGGVGRRRKVQEHVSCQHEAHVFKEFCDTMSVPHPKHHVTVQNRITQMRLLAICILNALCSLKLTQKLQH